MYLLLDTSSPEHFTVGLIKAGGHWLAVQQIASHFTQSERILPNIERLLGKNKISPTDIAAILAVNGPGGFTSLRIGVITADSLGYVWRKPVFPLKTGEYNFRTGLNRHILQKLKRTKPDSQVVPQYGHPPNITKPRQNPG
jgi:tRNA threonylcarbamoyl adenosine modification protein YeaZ